MQLLHQLAFRADCVKRLHKRPRGAVLMDAGYGVDTDLRTSITALGLSYVAGIQSHTMGAWHRAASAKEVVGS